jgi:hypothetical protein
MSEGSLNPCDSIQGAHFEHGALKYFDFTIPTDLAAIQYSEEISKYAEAKFQRDGVELVTSAR